MCHRHWSLSARRAWIEMHVIQRCIDKCCVALRKESVDRNANRVRDAQNLGRSLSARRAWIEISRPLRAAKNHNTSLSARRAWIEITSDASERESLASLSARRAWIEMYQS